MTDQAQWDRTNEKYLEAALTWLRLRLDAGARLELLSPHSAASEKERKSPPRSHSDDQVLPRATAEQIKSAANDMTGAADFQPPPAAIILAKRFGLSDFERNVLLLCAAIELDSRVATLCALAQGDATRTYPTFALAMTMFDDAAWDVLSPERPLRHWRMIEINQPGAQPLTTSALRADEWIVNYLKGLSYIDDRLTPLLVRMDSVGHEKLPPSQQSIVEKIVERLSSAIALHQFPIIQLTGIDSSAKRLIASHAAAALGLHLYRLPARLLPTQAGDLETLARLWERQNVLLPVSLYLDAFEAETGTTTEPQGTPPLNRFLTRSNGIFFLDTREPWPVLDRESVVIDVMKPTTAEQQRAWTEVLGPHTNGMAAKLSGQFNLNFREIQQIARSSFAVNSQTWEDLLTMLWDACVNTTRPRLDALALRIDPKATWEDIVLPPAEIELLHEISDQVGQRNTVYETWGFHKKMNRGLGISALFAGESGTGKTMAAEVIANELRLNLYRIDLSAVVSKYIGETEKNLRRLFDAAESGGTILFFDEADSLFGKRSEVKDSHDRYANIEINYLLQRMESYRGLAILATNMKSALDTAFIRRLRFIVTFQAPTVAERRAIWEKVFPRDVPTKDLNFERLARFNLTGGNIHSIALNAAFLAARDECAVTMPLVLRAARAEFRKLERPINEADFRWPTAKGATG
jgi:hypothetical protein